MREIRGQWLTGNGQVVEDEECRKIGQLISTRLRRISEREAGWTGLYEDPITQELWELSYPQSDLHGGGPPLLTPITPEQARERYPDLPPPTSP